MSTMTPAEAVDALRAAADQAEGILADEVAQLGAVAVERIRAAWPVDTGLSQDAWATERTTATTTAIVNDTRYASYVHDGLADSIVPPILDDLEADLEARVDERLRPILEGDRR